MRDAVKTAFANSIFVGYRHSCSILGRAQYSNSLNVLVRQFRFPILFSSRESPLFDCVSNVISRCAKKQMVWIDTRWVVAFVTAVQRFFKITKCEQVRKPMCCVHLSSEHHRSIPVTIFSSIPNPALIWTSFFNLAPKSFFGSLSSHKSLHLICATLLARQGAGAFSFSPNSVNVST